MNSQVVYETEYGNAERIARATAETLSDHGEARVAPVRAIPTLTAEGLDLLDVGAPTKRHGLPVTVRDLLEGTPGGTLEKVRALAYDTRYHRMRWSTGSAAREIGKHLAKEEYTRWRLLP